MLGRFLRYLLPLAVLGYVILLAFSAIFGEGTVLIAAMMAVAVLVALLLCVLEKLADLEKKLDQLMRDWTDRIQED